MNNKSGYFQVVQKEDGTYLKIFPPVGSGERIKIEEIKKYLEEEYGVGHVLINE